MAKIIVKQVKSIIGRPENQRKIVLALGLGRLVKQKKSMIHQVFVAWLRAFLIW